MSKVLIGSNGEALTLIRDASDRIVDAVTAELRSGTLSASRQVVHSYATSFSDLVAFFESLAQHWLGCGGERRWDLMEGDLSLRAMHQYRHVQRPTADRAPILRRPSAGADHALCAIPALRPEHPRYH